MLKPSSGLFHQIICVATILLLQACSPQAGREKPIEVPTVAAAIPEVPTVAAAIPIVHDYCIGRLALSTESDIHLSTSEAQFYWGDIQTYRESPAEYEQRLRTAQAIPRSQAKRKSIESIQRFQPNSGIVLILHEEELAPIDPNVATIIGLAYRDGTTFEYKKQILSRLKDISAQRVKSILQSVTALHSPFAPTTQAGFCLMHGALNLAPLKGWNESTQLKGDFMLQGKQFRFSLGSYSMNSQQSSEDELINQRDLIAHALGGTALTESGQQFDPASSAKAGALTGSARMFTVALADATQPVYEWHRAGRTNDPFQPAIILYVWPVENSADDSQALTQLNRWAQSHPEQVTPLFNITLNAQAVDAKQGKAAPAPEESKVVYRPRLAYRGDSEFATNRRYQIFKNKQMVQEGRSSAAGFPKAQNADYGEEWNISVLSN